LGGALFLAGQSGLWPKTSSLGTLVEVLGAGLAVLGLIIFLYRSWHVLGRNSVRIPDAATEGVKTSELKAKFCKSEDEVDMVAQFAHHAFNPRLKKFSSADYERRRDIYRNWFRKQPDAFVGIWNGELLVGCSILVELTGDAMAAYRTNQRDGYAFSPSEVVSPNQRSSVGPAHLFWQTFFLWPSGLTRWPWLLLISFPCWPFKNRKWGSYLRQVAISHMALVSANRHDELVVVAPRNTRVGQFNMKRLGAREVEKSKGNFRRFEICTTDETSVSENAKSFIRELLNSPEHLPLK
jgi:hypothetical protein